MLVTRRLTDLNIASGEMVSRRYRDLLPYLFTSYRDGYVVSELDQPAVLITKMFYPRWWLQLVGYFSAAAVNRARDSLLLGPAPHPSSSSSPSAGKGVSLPIYFLSLLLAAGVGAVLSLSLSTAKPRAALFHLRRKRGRVPIAQTPSLARPPSLPLSLIQSPADVEYGATYGLVAGCPVVDASFGLRSELRGRSGEEMMSLLVQTRN